MNRSSSQGLFLENKSHANPFGRLDSVFLSPKCQIVFMALVVISNSSFGFDDNKPEFENDILTKLNSRQGTAYLQTNGNELKPVSNARDGGIAVFQKHKDGLEILGNYIEVHLNTNGQIARIVDDSTAQLETTSDIPQVTAEDAIDFAENKLKNLRTLDSDARLVWFRRANVAKLAWQVETELAFNDEPGSPTVFNTVVDAINGDVLSQTQIDEKIQPSEEETDIFLRRIVINDQIGPSGSRNYALDFPAVAEIRRFGAQRCTGALISPNVLISARHCSLVPGDTINFGPNGNSPIFSTTVQSVSLPDGPGNNALDGGDVAILRLNANVPPSVAVPMRFIDETSGLVGMTAITVGYGSNGVGSTGHQSTSDGRRWGGENIIDRFGAPAATSSGGTNIISTDFDDGTSGSNTISGSSATPLQFEATTAPGDSGGPIIVNVNGEDLIAGVLTAGTTSTSVYGDVSWWTGTAIYRSQIESNGGQFASGGGGTPPTGNTPINDDFADTLALTNSSLLTTTASTSGSNMGATTETGEQHLAATGATVWWYFRANVSGTVAVNTFGSDYDTQLHVYTGYFSGATPADLTLVANNDDSGGTLQSRVEFSVQADQWYEIRVGGYAGRTGNIDLSAEYTSVTNTGVLPDYIGVRRGNSFIMDSNGDGAFQAGVDDVTSFGLFGDIPIVGDFNGDGFSELGVRRFNTFYLDTNGDGTFQIGVDQAISFGLAFDTPVVGDWNGDGTTDLGVRRGNTFWLDTNGDGVFQGGIDDAISFGLASDTPVVGDWNGDGITDLGVRRGNTFWLDTNGDGTFQGGLDEAISFGLATDIPIVGDWNGDGITDLGVRRGSTFWLDSNGDRIFQLGVDEAISFGLPGDFPVAGAWR